MTVPQYSHGFSCRLLRMAQLLVTLLSVSSLSTTDGFVPANVQRASQPSFGLERQHCQRYQRRQSRVFLYGDSYDDEEEEDDDDDFIDTDSLGDWRNFRRSLAMDETHDDNDSDDESAASKKKKDSTVASLLENEREVTDNERVLEEQNPALAEEYGTGVWAHQVSTVSVMNTIKKRSERQWQGTEPSFVSIPVSHTISIPFLIPFFLQPEVGGLVVRMPLEVELYRNYRHSITGSKLRSLLTDDGEGEDIPMEDLVMSHWYGRSRDLIESEMKKIAEMADEEGQIDATTLTEDYSEMLHLYLDNQETWQEVCLVLEQLTDEEGSKSSKTLVLNRPMAFKLTRDLGRLVYFGGLDDNHTKLGRKNAQGLTRFMLAFQEECAVYVGGPDDQGKAATLIHGIKDLPGAVEISKGSNIYRGGLEAAVDGILDGRFSPLEFRFFVGCHNYEESMLDVEVLLGKYQPIACARSIALKQCISLPKPLWHEVMELCDGEFPDLSRLELLKRDDVIFQVLDEEALDNLEILLDGDDEDFDIEILDDDDEDETPTGW